MTRIAPAVAFAPALALALALAAVVAALPTALAQPGSQPETVPGDFANGQQNGFGRIAMEPYVQADGQPVLVEARITLADLDTVARASNLLFAINLHADEAKVTDQRLSSGGQVFTPLRTDTAEGGLQSQGFYDPAEVLAAARDGQVDLLLTATATAKANGQWHVGALVIAFDAGWGTLRASDGGSAVLYGFSLLMERGLAGSAVAPFHGQGNAGIILVPLVVGVVGVVAGGWQVAALVRERSRGPAVPSPVPAPLPAPMPASGAAMPVQRPPAASTAPLATAGPGSPAPGPAAAVAAPLQAARRRRQRDIWTMDFGYRLDPAQEPALGGPPAAAPAAAEPARLAPVQGPRLPAGMAPGPWRPTPMPGTSRRATLPPAAELSPSPTEPTPTEPTPTVTKTRPGRKTKGAPRPARRPTPPAAGPPTRVQATPRQARRQASR